MKDNLKLYFSLISGELFYIEEDEIKNMDETQIPLKKKPNSSCNKCYGRFHVGFHTQGKYYIPCPKCLRKCADFDLIKDDITVEAPKTTNQIADEQFTEAMDAAFGNA